MGVLCWAVGLWGCLACGCLAWATVAFVKFSKIKFHRLRSDEDRRRFRAFRRVDEGQLSYLYVALGAVLVMPIRVVLFLSILIMNLLVLTVLDWIVPEGGDIKQNLFTRAVSRVFINVTFRTGLLVAVGLHMREHNRGADPRRLTTPAVVSNHVSMFDIIYLLWSIRPSFVAKASVSKVPLLGNAARSLGCIFVDRLSKHGRESALGNLKKRQAADGPNHSPLVVFPEGTTSNGINVLPFKRGVFLSLNPVTPVALIYRSPLFNLAYDSIPGIWWTALVFSSPCISTVDAYWMAPVHPPSAPGGDQDSDNAQRAEKFAELARKSISDALVTYHDAGVVPVGVKLPEDWEGTLADKCDCIRALLGKNSCNAEYPTRSAAESKKD